MASQHNSYIIKKKCEVVETKAKNSILTSFKDGYVDVYESYTFIPYINKRASIASWIIFS